MLDMLNLYCTEHPSNVSITTPADIYANLPLILANLPLIPANLAVTDAACLVIFAAFSAMYANLLIFFFLRFCFS